MAKFSLVPCFVAALCVAMFFSCSSVPPQLEDSSSSVVSSSSGTASSSSSIQLGSSSSVYSSSSVGGSSSSATASSSGSVTTNDPDLIKKTITLSFAGESYADIDGNVTTYKQTAAASANVRNKIDLIANCGTTMWCENNSIYTPWEIGLFWTDDDDFLGNEDVLFFEIPSEQAEIFKTATKLSQILPALNALIDIINDTEGVDEIPIVKDKVFLVHTSERNICIVIIKASGSQTVTLEIIQIPSN